jgi:hypothetical protein
VTLPLKAFANSLLTTAVVLVSISFTAKISSSPVLTCLTSRTNQALPFADEFTMGGISGLYMIYLAFNMFKTPN